MNAKKAYNIAERAHDIPKNLSISHIADASEDELVGMLDRKEINHKIIINNGTAKTILDIANASMEEVISPKLNLFLIIFSK